MDTPNIADWPIPGRRWRSFEAEPLRMTTYRYDSRLPSTIWKEGFNGITYSNKGLPRFAQFGRNTVFSAGSRAGVQRYLEEDWNCFRFDGDGISHRWRNLRTKRIGADEFLDTELKAPHLYRIKTDTHNAIPFKDFHEEFGGAFTKYSVTGGPKDILQKETALDNMIMPANRKNPFFRHYDDSIRKAYSPNDEVHIKGSVVKASRANPGQGIEYAGMEYLDLEVETYTIL